MLYIELEVRLGLVFRFFDFVSSFLFILFDQLLKYYSVGYRYRRYFMDVREVKESLMEELELDIGFERWKNL